MWHLPEQYYKGVVKDVFVNIFYSFLLKIRLEVSLVLSTPS